MRRGYANIKLGNEYKRVRGLLSKNFLIHKTRKGEYSITHIQTGLLVRSFTYLRTAREIVSRFERGRFPIIWEGVTAENASKNMELTDNIIAEVSYKS